MGGQHLRRAQASAAAPSPHLRSASLPATTDDPHARCPRSLWTYAGVYAGLSGLASVLNLFGTISLYLSFLRVSAHLHSQTLQGVMASPMAFFDTTPTGRILNRFSKELEMVDRNIVGNWRTTVVFGLRLLGSAYFIVYGSSPWLLVLVPPLAISYYYVQKYYRSSSRELQRLNSISKSPLYSAFNEALGGAATIQAPAAEGGMELPSSHLPWTLRHAPP